MLRDSQSRIEKKETNTKKTGFSVEFLRFSIVDTIDCTNDFVLVLFFSYSKVRCIRNGISSYIETKERGYVYTNGWL